MPSIISSVFNYVFSKAFVQQMVVSFAIGEVMKMFAEEPEFNNTEFKGNLKLNNTSNVAPIPVVYGRARVGGSEYRAVQGTDNEYLLRCLVVSEGEIEAYENVYLNDRNINDSVYQINSVTNLITTDLTKKGTATQTVSTLMQNASQWTTDHKGKGVAYIVARLKYDRDVFASGLPALTVDVKGKKLYDPRKDSTVTGGSGNHSQEGSTNWEWTENPALCILDFLTSPIYGRGIPYSDIDLQTFITEANYCDATVLTITDADGTVHTNQPRYTCNGVVNPNKKSVDVLRDLLSSCRGSLVVTDKYKLVIDKPETSVFTFDKTNIIGNWTISGAGVRSYKNKVNAKFRDVDNRYERNISVTSSDAFLTEDNNRELTIDAEFTFTNKQQRVDILSQHMLKQSRLKWQISFTATIEAIALEACDVVRIKHSTVGYDSGVLSNGKLYRITSVELTSSDTVKVTAIEYDANVYTFNLNSPPTAPSTSLPDPLLLSPPTNLTLTSSGLHLINNNGTIIERIKATWTRPSIGYVHYYEIAYKAIEDSNFTIIACDDTAFFISPVNSATTVGTTALGTGVSGQYDVKVRAVYPKGRRSAFITVSGHQVTGKTTAPNKPTSFTYSQTSDYTRQFNFTAPADRDIKGFIIKGSTNQTATWDNMDTFHTGHLTVSPFETKQIQSGTYRFAIRAEDTSGNLSEAVFLPNTDVTDDPNMNILNAYYPRLLGWTQNGTITNGYLASSGDIEATEAGATWGSLGGTTWDNWNEWGFTNSGLFYSFDGIEFGTTLTFKPIIQTNAIGTVAHVFSYVPATHTGTITANDYTTPVDPSTLGSISARAFKTVTNVVGVNATLKTLGILLDGQIQQEILSNIDTSDATTLGANRIGTGHIKVPTQTSFTEVTSLQVSFINAGTSTAGFTYEIISKKSTSVADTVIKIYNSSNQLADATIDIQVQGF
jgi:hypothetical protein